MRIATPFKGSSILPLVIPAILKRRPWAGLKEQPSRMQVSQYRNGQDVYLWPVVKEAGHSITFISAGESSVYRYVDTDDVTVAPRVIQQIGYTFAGWKTSDGQLHFWLKT